MIRVAAGILARDDRVLICRRRKGGAFPLKWEFPGGKLQDGETPEAALVRELAEELGIFLAVDGLGGGQRLGRPAPGAPDVADHFFPVGPLARGPTKPAFEEGAS